MNELTKIDRVLNITSKVFDIDKDLLKTNSRKNKLNLARQIACVLSIKTLGIHKVKVAKRVNRDRTSMNHYLRNHDDNYNNWKPYRDKYDQIFIKVTKGNKKNKFLHKNKFNKFVNKIKITFCQTPDMIITVTSGKYKKDFLVGIFNFERDIKTINDAFVKYDYKIDYKTYEG